MNLSCLPGQSSCLSGQPVKLSRIMATKPTSQMDTRLDSIEQVDQFAENVSKMRVCPLSRQTNRQVEWILD